MEHIHVYRVKVVRIWDPHVEQVQVYTCDVHRLHMWNKCMSCTYETHMWSTYTSTG